MKFGIIAAMEEEKRLLEEEMTIEKKTTVANWEFIEGTLVGKSICPSSIRNRESDVSTGSWNLNRPLRSRLGH